MAATWPDVVGGFALTTIVRVVCRVTCHQEQATDTEASDCWLCSGSAAHRRCHFSLGPPLRFWRARRGAARRGSARLMCSRRPRQDAKTASGGFRLCLLRLTKLCLLFFFGRLEPCLLEPLASNALQIFPPPRTCAHALRIELN